MIRVKPKMNEIDELDEMGLSRGDLSS